MPGGLQTAVDAEKPRKMDDRFAFATFLLLGYYVVIAQTTVRRRGIFLRVSLHQSLFRYFFSLLIINSDIKWIHLTQEISKYQT